MLSCASVYWCLVVTCWERADLMALVSDCSLWVCYFPIGILGQVWYLIVSIPDPCPLSYLYLAEEQTSTYLWTYIKSYYKKFYGLTPLVAADVFLYTIPITSVAFKSIGCMRKMTDSKRKIHMLVIFCITYNGCEFCWLTIFAIVVLLKAYLKDGACKFYSHFGPAEQIILYPNPNLTWTLAFLLFFI